VLASDTRYVWVVGVDRGTGAGVLFKSANGNDPTPTWNVVNIPQTIPTPFMSVKVYSNQIIYISGANGTILRTRDGGLTWDRIPSPPTQLLKDTVSVWHNSLWLNPYNSDCLWTSGDAFNYLGFTNDAGLNWAAYMTCPHR
jgi:photosystem II stability/assembly factor-like uncharacterized protein